MTTSPFKPDGIPDDLKAVHRWLLHNNKKPVNPRGGTGSPTDTAKMDTFPKTVAAFEAGKIPCTGIGFAFNDDDTLAGIDLDKCIVDGVLEDWAEEIVELMDSYTEYSPSGRGLHIYFRTHLRFGKNGDRVEAYTHGRYFTVTGDTYRDSPVMERNAEAKEVLDKYFPGWEKDNGSYSQVAVEGFDPGANPPGELFGVLLANDGEFARLWTRTSKRGKGTSDSDYDFFVAVHALRAGWSDEQVVALLCAYRRQWGDAKGKLGRPDYFDRTVKNAKAMVNERKDDKQIAEALAYPMHTADSQPEDVLTTLSSQLQLNQPIDKIIKRGMDPSEFFFVVGGSELYIGETDVLMSPRETKRRLYELQGIVIPAFKQSEWDRLLADIALVQEYEDTGDRLEESLASLREYLDNVGVHDEKHWQDAFVASRPYYRGDDLYVSVEGWQRSVDSRRSLNSSNRRKLVNRLKQIGFTNKTVTARIDGRGVLRKYWYINSGAISESL